MINTDSFFYQSPQSPQSSQGHDPEAINAIITHKLVTGRRIALPENLTLKNLRVPAGTKEIAENTYGGYRALKSVNLPDSLEKIGQAGFCGCGALDQLKLPKAITTIGIQALAGTAIHTLVLPPLLEEVASELCLNADKLQQVILGPKVEKIGDEAFSGCTNLSDFYCFDTLEADQIELSAFLDCCNLSRVHLMANPAQPAGLLSKVKLSKKLEDMISANTGSPVQIIHSSDRYEHFYDGEGGSNNAGLVAQQVLLPQARHDNGDSPEAASEDMPYALGMPRSVLDACAHDELTAVTSDDDDGSDDELERIFASMGRAMR